MELRVLSKFVVTKNSKKMNKASVMVMLVISHISLFVGGRYSGIQQTIESFIRKTQQADAEIMLGHYTTYRDIAQDVGKGNVARAKCNAELGASTMLDGIKDCMSSEVCRAVVQDSVLRSAAEIVEGKALPFDCLVTKAW